MQYKTYLVLLLALALAACSAFSAPTPTPEPTPAITPTPSPEPTATPAYVFGPDPFSQGLIARRNGDYARAIAAFQATLNSGPSPELAGEAQFRLGEAFWLYNDDVRAINAFGGYLQGNPDGVHAPESHYFLGDAYRALKDYDDSLAQFKMYRNQTQMLAGDIDGTIADIMVLAGDANGAITQYDRALQDTTLATTARINILMRIADVYQGRGEPAKAAAPARQLSASRRVREDLRERKRSCGWDMRISLILEFSNKLTYNLAASGASLSYHKCGTIFCILSFLLCKFFKII